MSDALHHGLRDADLHCAIGARALGVRFRLIIDQIVRIVGKERVHARPGNPCRLRIGQRDFFRRLALAIAARTVAVSVAMHLIIASSV